MVYLLLDYNVVPEIWAVTDDCRVIQSCSLRCLTTLSWNRFSSKQLSIIRLYAHNRRTQVNGAFLSLPGQFVLQILQADLGLLGSLTFISLDQEIDYN